MENSSLLSPKNKMTAHDSVGLENIAATSVDLGESEEKDPNHGSGRVSAQGRERGKTGKLEVLIAARSTTDS